MLWELVTSPLAHIVMGDTMNKEQLKEKIKQLEKRIELLEKMAHPQGIMWPTTLPLNNGLPTFNDNTPVC